MGTTLQNGIFLPAEGERNCYTGLESNWRAIDGYIGGYNVHVEDVVIHVSQEDRNKWDAVTGKADASALTAHTGDTTIHVTAEDKAKWDAVTSKADDSDVVHKSGNETVGGAKTFSDTLTIYNNDSSQATKNLTISSSKIQVGDTSNSDSFGIVFNAGFSYVSRVIAFKDTSGTQNLQLAVRTKDSSNNLISSMIRLRLFANGISSFESDGDNLVSLGSSSNKWKNVQTYQINSLTPSSLSMPDIDNRVDISSYITDLTGVNNEYTPTVNGWICVRSGNATKISILDSATSIGNQSVSSTATYLTVMTPVVANRKVYINIMCTSLEHAYFIPCQGNV